MGGVGNAFDNERHVAGAEKMKKDTVGRAVIIGWFLFVFLAYLFLVIGPKVLDKF